ncbi:hypothetical protein HSBAA_27990 [Vreelandella sulfidaeris]|uniref:Uncharacterized protein n=1 Tax=Vreelandella sulfidaeris TaxID=115553 RepID=A0A455U8D8_9GAMM|nr:hypothetical protein HSBAA_27990 [Halomonas sulfidaeris]
MAVGGVNNIKLHNSVPARGDAWNLKSCTSALIPPWYNSPARVAENAGNSIKQCPHNGVSFATGSPHWRQA